ncbi:hypothetical protein [Geomicrobium sp. JCM 19055]|uniref:hypothetical protein n=1 Tax=Geomicrobium sp. JCM 19055 TaxID=1460649 RepID=UPI00045ECCE3|nr:hypothetical protein [Geomicrobium sp. JCM 19055]GAK01122.1 hypothetical protein JCM19055_4268 [Geomicrobium sp. JCM 19055]
MIESVRWPDGQTVAAVLTFDVDGETAHLAEPRNQDRPSLLSMGTYGRGIGLDRLLLILRKHDVLATFFCAGGNRRNGFDSRRANHWRRPCDWTSRLFA